MRSAVFYLLHSTAIAGLMVGSYFYGFKQAIKGSKESLFKVNKNK
jgi:hypothetical protein